jgi:succinoglycan biosynthesis protein ExoO
MTVSVLMANRNGIGHLPAAIASVLRQSHADLELIVSDDGSDDGSPDLVRRLAARDPRLRLVERPAGAAGGPGAARNRALATARGDWIAVVDGDDLIHPERLARMTAAADRLGADLVADDLVFFGTSPGTGGRTLLQPLGLRAPREIDAAEFLAASGEGARLPAYGYLKPLIRRAALGGLSYDETLTVGEDYDLVLRMLIAGARYALLPDPTYLYRRHAASVSHRLSAAAAAAILAAHDRVSEAAPAGLAPALAGRRPGLVRALAYARLVEAVKARRAGRAALMLAKRPALAGMLARSLGERLSRAPDSPGARAGAPIRLGTGLPLSRVAPLSVPCTAPPAQGGAWETPPAEMAAALSALSERHHLRPETLDAAGAWAVWLLPEAYPGPEETGAEARPVAQPSIGSRSRPAGLRGPARPVTAASLSASTPAAMGARFAGGFSASASAAGRPPSALASRKARKR